MAEIVGRVVYPGASAPDAWAVKSLLKNQLEGIRKITATGMTVKVNTVLVPDVNEGHIHEVARAVKEAGASIYNIIPLIPQPGWPSAGRLPAPSLRPGLVCNLGRVISSPCWARQSALGVKK